MYQNVIISYLYETQHVSGYTRPIIRSLKLHWQPLFFLYAKVVGREVGGRCQATPDNVHLQRVFQICWDNSIPLYLHAAICLEVSLLRWTSKNAFSRETAVYKW